VRADRVAIEARYFIGKHQLAAWPICANRELDLFSSRRQALFLRRPPHVHLRVQSRGRDDAYEVEIPGASADGGFIALELVP
jgi:hypothetical protein